MAEFNLDKMASKMAEKALDEFICNGKTLREWIEIIVAQDLFAISELEKIKAEMDEYKEFQDGHFIDASEMKYALMNIIDTHLYDLKGEENENP